MKDEGRRMKMESRIKISEIGYFLAPPFERLSMEVPFFLHSPTLILAT
jgi:hypothetical protein